MSQTKRTSGVHKLTIRNKPGTEGKISTGATTQVLLDGEPLRGVSFLKFEVKARGVTKVLVELYAEVDAEAFALIKEGPKNRTPFKKAGSNNHYAKFALSSYEPEAIATKEEES